MTPVRVLVARWPDWPTRAAGLDAGTPAAVVAANRVVAATAAARAEGVVPGLRRREAQGRCPPLMVVAADTGRDAREWEPVVVAVEALTPAVEVFGPGMLGFATRGPSRYFGGDAALARRVQAVMEDAAGASGCLVGVADGRFTATLAASVGAVVPPGSSPGWLAPQPVSALGARFAELSDLLGRLGVRTLGDLAALPEPAVLGRFGPEGVAAQRLASGLDDRAVSGRPPPPDLSGQAEMDPPERRVEAAAFVAKALADDVLARLERAGLTTTMVAIEARTEHGEVLVRRWRHEGALSAAALAERARWQLDGWLAGSAGTVPSGGLVLLRLTPEEVRPDGGGQTGFWGGTSDRDSRAARALARVQGLCGPEAVVTAVLSGGRGFAEQVRLVPWGDAREEAAGGDAPWPGRTGRPAPALVYRPGRPADVCDRAGRPVEISGRGLLSSPPVALAVENEPFVAITHWAGPWPLEERWWDGGGRRRARLQVLLTDRQAHLLYREGGRWWVEASYA